jgi:hypothetical protein
MINKQVHGNFYETEMINNQGKKDQSLKGFNLFKSIHLANDKR